MLAKSNFIVITVLISFLVVSSAFPNVLPMEDDVIPTTYRKIIDDLKLSSTLKPVTRFDLSSFSPFCANFSKPSDDHYITPECLRWEVRVHY